MSETLEDIRRRAKRCDALGNIAGFLVMSLPTCWACEEPGTWAHEYNDDLYCDAHKGNHSKRGGEVFELKYAAPLRDLIRELDLYPRAIYECTNPKCGKQFSARVPKPEHVLICANCSCTMPAAAGYVCRVVRT